MKKKLVSKPSSSGSSSSNTSLSAGWMDRGESEIEKRINEQRALQQNRAPEFFLMDGDSKTIRFRTDIPICSFFTYSIQVGGKWRQYVAPEQGKPDAFGEEGARSSMRIAYEVIDKEGYTDRKGKSFRNVPRFYLLNPKQYEQIKIIRKKCGPLNTFDITVSRSGTGQKTTYSFIPMARTPMSDKLKLVEKLSPRFTEFYKPLSYEQQKAVMRRGSTGDDLND